LKRPAPFLALATLAAALLASVGIYKHDRFSTGGYDLGIFDQTIWGYSHFEIIANTVKRIPNLLGDHFHLILFTLAPLYWLWNDARVLLIAQAILLALSSLPLAAWANRTLGRGPALVVQVSYLLFWGLLAAAVFDFHELAFAPLAISLALYGTLARRDWLLLTGVAIGLAIREDVTLTMLALGFYVAVVQGRRRLGLAITAVSAAWFAVVVWVVMPALAGQSYGYWAYQLEPVHVLGKLQTLAALLGAWLVLPLLSPLLLVAGPNLAERLFSTTPSHWSMGFHYSLVVAPILGFAAVDVLVRIKARRAGLVLPLAAAMMVAGAVTTFAVVRPLRPLTRLISASRADEIQACLRTIRPGASVSATEALVPHLSHRRQIYPLYVGRPTDYIAIDTSTSIAGLTRQRTRTIVQRSLREGYNVRCRRGATIVLGR
jgi:uncharacterized membrane protein